MSLNSKKVDIILMKCINFNTQKSVLLNFKEGHFSNWSNIKNNIKVVFILLLFLFLFAFFVNFHYTESSVLFIKLLLFRSKNRTCESSLLSFWVESFTESNYRVWTCTDLPECLTACSAVDSPRNGSVFRFVILWYFACLI